MSKFKIGDFVEINKNHYNLNKIGCKFLIQSTTKCDCLAHNERCTDGYDISICPGHINGKCFGYTPGFSLTKIGEKSINSNIVLEV